MRRKSLLLHIIWLLVCNQVCNGYCYTVDHPIGCVRKVTGPYGSNSIPQKDGSHSTVRYYNKKSFAVVRKMSQNINMQNQPIRKGCADFWYGVTFVTDNYFSLLKTILKRQRILYIPFLLVSLVGSIWFPSLSNTMRLVVETIIRHVYSLAGIVRMILLNPFLVIVKFIHIFLTIGPSAPQPSSLLRKKEITTIQQIIIGPLLEEVMYRFIIWWLFNKASRVVTRTKEEVPSNKDNEYSKEVNNETKWFGLYPWMLISSVVFASVHIGNFLPFRSVDENSKLVAKTQMILQDEFQDVLSNKEQVAFILAKLQFLPRFFLNSPILGILFITTVTFTTSSAIYCPMFHSRGLMAAFGAHVAWNYFAKNFILCVSLRMFFSMIASKTKRSYNTAD